MYVYGTNRIVNGTIYGNNETDTSLRNTVYAGAYGSAVGAALYKGSNATAQRGTFSIPDDITSQWNSSGSLISTNDTIRVVNGELQ